LLHFYFKILLETDYTLSWEASSVRCFVLQHLFQLSTSHGCEHGRQVPTAQNSIQAVGKKAVVSSINRDGVFRYKGPGFRVEHESAELHVADRAQREHPESTFVRPTKAPTRGSLFPCLG